MKREEAIAILQEKHDECKTFYDLAAHPEDAYPGTKEYMEALQIAIAALRGPTRERVVKAWRSEWDYPTCEWNLPKCPKCGCNSKDATYGHKSNFCPRCGSPMTDEAVDIVMERLEALKDEID